MAHNYVLRILQFESKSHDRTLYLTQTCYYCFGSIRSKICWESFPAQYPCCVLILMRQVAVYSNNMQLKWPTWMGLIFSSSFDFITKEKNVLRPADRLKLCEYFHAVQYSSKNFHARYNECIIIYNGLINIETIAIQKWQMSHQTYPVFSFKSKSKCNK